MHIEDVILAPGTGAFFYDDQAAIRSGVETDGFRYLGRPQTPGFPAIRIPAETLGIGLRLSDRSIVWGDMMSVQYSGAAGRDPLFRSQEIAGIVETAIIPRLLGCETTNFHQLCASVFAPLDGAPVPRAIEYGVSQALLHAVSRDRRLTAAEVIRDELRLDLPWLPVPIYAQSGDAREINVDKMILKQVDVLPHGLINSREKFGYRGETLREFVRWVGARIREVGGEGYLPTLHFDVYGWIGLEIGMEPGAIADFIALLETDAEGFALNIECPADFGSRDAQVENYAAIVKIMAARGSKARIVVDERCNTLSDIALFAEAKAAHLIQIKMPDVGSIADTASAVLICKTHGVGAYVGGSCAETDLSARTSVHVSVATQADMMLAKPGMGVDEALCIVGNEQSRLLAEVRHPGRNHKGGYAAGAKPD